MSIQLSGCVYRMHRSSTDRKRGCVHRDNPVECHHPDKWVRPYNASFIHSAKERVRELNASTRKYKDWLPSFTVKQKGCAKRMHRSVHPQTKRQGAQRELAVHRDTTEWVCQIVHPQTSHLNPVEWVRQENINTACRPS